MRIISLHEEQSATLMCEVAKQLQLPKYLSKEAKELILVSKIGAVPKTDLERLQKDIDYAIMGQPASIYDCYAEGIRFEYSWVPPEVFREKRSEFLEKTLQRATQQGLYYTNYFKKMYEEAAKMNMERELQQLREE